MQYYLKPLMFSANNNIQLRPGIMIACVGISIQTNFLIITASLTTSHFLFYWTPFEKKSIFDMPWGF